MKCKVVLLNIILFAVMLFTFTVNVFAYDATESDFYEKAIDELTENLDDDTKDFLSALGLEDYSPEELSNLSFGDVISVLTSAFAENFTQPAHSVCIVLALLILISLSGGLISEHGSMSGYFEFIALMFIALYCFSQIIEMVTDTVAVIHAVCGLMKLLIPILTAVVSFSGNPSLATGSSAISLYISELIILVCDEFLAVMLCIMTAVCVSTCINSSVKTTYVIELVKKIFNYVLGFLGAVYSGVLTIRDIVSADIDNLSVKGLRFILGSSVPIVGGTLSEGLSAALSALSLFKNTFGIFGIVIAIVVSLPIFIRLFCWLLSLVFCEYIASSMGYEKISSVFSSFRYIMSMLISLLIFIIFIFLISVSTVLILSKK